MDALNVIKYPVSNEKAIRLMESENILTFIVESKAEKEDVKKAVEKIFKTKVVDVKTMNDMKGRKKAYVKLSKETPTIDIATQLGMM